MSELRDYQRMFVDNVIDDFTESLSLDEARSKIESRILTYDRERKEQVERDLPTAITRAVQDIL